MRLKSPGCSAVNFFGDVHSAARGLHGARVIAETDIAIAQRQQSVPQIAARAEGIRGVRVFGLRVRQGFQGRIDGGLIVAPARVAGRKVGPGRARACGGPLSMRRSRARRAGNRRWPDDLRRWIRRCDSGRKRRGPGRRARPLGRSIPHRWAGRRRPAVPRSSPRRDR